jgi:hypothetical protein
LDTLAPAGRGSDITVEWFLDCHKDLRRALRHQTPIQVHQGANAGILVRNAGYGLGRAVQRSLYHQDEGDQTVDLMEFVQSPKAGMASSVGNSKCSCNGLFAHSEMAENRYLGKAFGESACRLQTDN